MKYRSILVLAGCLLLLTACGKEAPQVTLPPVTQEVTTAAQTTESQVPETLPPETEETRPQTTEIPLIYEGMETPVPMILWQRPDYSLYFNADSSWYLEETENLGYPVDLWQPSLNSLVEFSVVHLGQGDEMESHDYLRQAYPDLDVSSWDIGTWTGSNMQTLEMLEARFRPGEEESYLLIGKYPMEAAEGFGVTISGMMKTFEINE